MSFPASVPTLRSIKNKGGRPRKIAAGEEAADAAGNAQATESYGGASGKDGLRELGGVELEFGAEGGARVERRGKGWSWGYVSEHQDDIEFGLGKPAMLVPPTRLLPAAPLTARPSTAQSLEYARQICDKYEHLGLEDLITEELEMAHKQGAYDPFLGRQMVSQRNPFPKLARNVVLYTGGELGNELYMATVLGDTDKHVKNARLNRFIPSSTPVERYSTRILQIASSPLVSLYRDDLHATCLLVRQHSSLMAYRLTPNPSYSPANPSSSSMALVKMGEIRPKEVGGRRVVDAVLDPEVWGCAAVVDESGGVWMWGWKRGSTAGTGTMELTMIRQAVTTEKNNFFRIAYGPQAGSLLVMSASEAYTVDVEDPDQPQRKIVTLPPDRLFTAIDTTASGRQCTYTCLATTRQILWIDEDRPESNPVMSWKHELSEGELRDIQITHLTRDDSDCYVLTSRSCPAILVFHVSNHGALRFLHPPHTLSLPIDARRKPLADVIFVDRNVEKTDLGETSPLLIALATDGSIWSAEIAAGTAEEGEGETGRFRAVWDAELQAEADKASHELAAVKVNEKGETSYTIFDARWAWLAINKDTTPEEDDPIFNADEFGRYLREIDAPFDHFVTAAELARDSVLAEGEPKRSHLLRPLPLLLLVETETVNLSSLDYTRDLHIVHTHTIPSSAVDTHLSNTDGGPMTSLSAILETLRTAYPERADTQAAKSRHRKAVEALAVDLALSTAVLSSEAVAILAEEEAQAERNADDEMLARAAGLSLSEAGPPAVTFSVLKPRLPAEDVEDEADGEAVPHPLLGSIQQPTARSLLAEWTISPPSSYTWRPWLSPPEGDAGTHPPAHLTIVAPTAQRPIRPLPSPRSSRPGSPNANLAAAPKSFSQPAAPRRDAPPIIVQSQPALQGWNQPRRKPGSVSAFANSGFGPRGSSPLAEERGRGRDSIGGEQGGGEGSQGLGLSQSLVATQVERGPFGGRGGEKKKKVKKRVGGF